MTCLSSFAQWWILGGVLEDDFMKLYITIISQIKQEQGNTLDSIVKGSRNIKIWKTQNTW